MTRLLVSVRDANEAIAALAGGADLIDVKEPRHGSLGRASAAVLAEVAEAVAGRAPLSAALGELGQPLDEPTLNALQHYAYAKIGLARAAEFGDWRRRWKAVLDRLPAHVASVAVVYADGEMYAAPPADEILSQASELECAAVLLDTFSKDGRGLFEHWQPARVGKFVELARRREWMSVLAGALHAEGAVIAHALRPDVIAVRSAVCGGSRTSAIRTDLVASMSAQLKMLSAAVGTTN